MAEIVRQLDQTVERGLYMPVDELLEPKLTEARTAVVEYMAACVNRGIREESGHLLVQLDDGTKAASLYRVFLED